jgi:hypothetical protein
MLDQSKTTALLEESGFLYCQSAPLEAARTMARALKRQQHGGKVAFIRALAEAIDADEPGFLLVLRNDMARPGKVR